MRWKLFLYLGPSLCLAGLAYLASTKIWLAFAVGVIGLFETIFLVAPMVKRFEEKERKRHECYRFVHSFLITLSVCDSLDKAYESGQRSFQGRLKEIDDSLSKLSSQEKVEYLSSYFHMPIYGVFLSLLDLYLDRGGDVLKVCSSLLEELTRMEESGLLLLAKKRRNLIQYALMWLMSLGIMSFIRYGLSSFFQYLTASSAYVLAIFAYFLFLFASVFIYALSYLGKESLRLRKRKEARP